MQTEPRFVDPAALDKHSLEEGTAFAPRFDASGLITCVTIEADSHAVLMVAFMNETALCETLDSGVATYWSRSRQRLWRKGETSGQFQHVVAMRTDCDQDALLLSVKVGGDGGCCHTGRHSCFYRTIERSQDGALTLVQAGLRPTVEAGREGGEG